jgi:vacuolar-type H+-ATPase catalytic subunit A/Vma1
MTISPSDRRRARVTEAWAEAFRKVSARVTEFCAEHGPPPNCIDMIRDYAPVLTKQIEQAEQDAEAQSVEWANGGAGGVQAKIDVWVSLWLEALEMVHLAR